MVGQKGGVLPPPNGKPAKVVTRRRKVYTKGEKTAQIQKDRSPLDGGLKLEEDWAKIRKEKLWVKEKGRVQITLPEKEAQILTKKGKHPGKQGRVVRDE